MRRRWMRRPPAVGRAGFITFDQGTAAIGSILTIAAVQLPGLSTGFDSGLHPL